MIAAVEDVKREARSPYRAVCRELDVPYSSLMRWKGRRQAGKPAVRKPGPAKIEPLQVATLYDEIRQLAHGRRRTRGTGALYERHRDEISRRDLAALVEAVRRELRRERDALERRIEWLAPGLVWSMDDADLDRFCVETGRLHLIQDLASHYKLRALGDEEMADGERVAGHLVSLFTSRVPPLLLKRDNARNLNHPSVNGALDAFGVIPLNSPAYYPPYNGGIERGQLEIQRELELRIGSEKVDPRVFRLECEISGYTINHKRRRSLGGQTACHVLEAGRPWVRLFGRRERKEVYEEIKRLAVDIAAQLDQHTDEAVETAFRYAAETWMQQNQFIRVSQNGKVLPCFYQIRSH